MFGIDEHSFAARIVVVRDLTSDAKGVRDLSLSTPKLSERFGDGHTLHTSAQQFVQLIRSGLHFEDVSSLKRDLICSEEYRIGGQFSRYHFFDFVDLGFGQTFNLNQFAFDSHLKALYGTDPSALQLLYVRSILNESCNGLALNNINQWFITHDSVVLEHIDVLEEGLALMEM